MNQNPKVRIGARILFITLMSRHYIKLFFDEALDLSPWEITFQIGLFIAFCTIIAGLAYDEGKIAAREKAAKEELAEQE